MDKKILFIDNDSNFTGSTISLGYLVKGFCENKFDVYILTSKSEIFSNYLMNFGAKTIYFRFPGMENIYLDLHFTQKYSLFTMNGFLRFLKNIAKFHIGFFVTLKTINKIKPDLIYLNEYVVIQSAIAGYMKRIPTVTHVRSRYLKGYFGIRNYLLSKMLITFNNIIFAITPEEAKQIEKFSKKKINKISVVGEFLSEENFKTFTNIIQLKKKFNLPADNKIILMIGGIQSIKGTMDFIKAARIVVKEKKGVLFVNAGVLTGNRDKASEEYYNNCYSIAGSSELKDYIKFTGEIKNITELIACSDILVSPSTETHFSRPVIEAWAMKKAVIASRTEHTMDLIENNVNGIIVNISAPEEIALAIINLLDNPDLLTSIGNEGYKKAKQDYCFENNFDVILKKCNSLIN